MRLKTLGVVCAITAAASFSAHAQGQPPYGAPAGQQGQGQQGQRPAPAAGRTEAGSPVTVMGCIEREADYRKAADAGKGGVAGTGVGVGNEFVLTHATSGGSTDAAFELTGSNEGQAAQFVGKRVEISGAIKGGETNASGNPTGGPTAGAPPKGVDVASKDLKLRELEVSSIKAATTGTCPAS